MFENIMKLFKKSNKKETLGYEDYLLEDDKYFASAKVNSQTCKVFVLEINFLNSLLKDRFISKNYIMTNYERKEIMLKRLRNIKNTFLNKFLENHKSSFLKINTIDIKKEKKETINYFKHSNTKISLKQNLKSKEYLPPLRRQLSASAFWRRAATATAAAKPHRRLRLRRRATRRRSISANRT